MCGKFIKPSWTAVPSNHCYMETCSETVEMLVVTKLVFPSPAFQLSRQEESKCNLFDDTSGSWTTWMKTWTVPSGTHIFYKVIYLTPYYKQAGTPATGDAWSGDLHCWMMAGALFLQGKAHWLLLYRRCKLTQILYLVYACEFCTFPFWMVCVCDCKSVYIYECISHELFVVQWGNIILK